MVHLDYWRLDHRSILLNVRRSLKSTTGGGMNSAHRFHFKECWADKGDCADIMIASFKTWIWVRDCMDCMLCLSPSSSRFLDATSMTKDNRCAVLDMAPSKAPCPNGLPAFFYQKLWSVVGSQVTMACLEVLNDDQRLDEVNNTLITLISKVKNANRISYFRPKSLCNVIYKIVAKALANRLLGVLHESLVNDLHCLSVRFWWGLELEKRKLYWGLIQDSFSPEEAVLIRSITFSLSPLPDTLMWHYDKLGLYSVKSGYHFAVSLASNPSTSGLNL
ncbi:hypothetical protein Ddye_016365 [Dipteronia dyeriana]|uniref:Reverse transcriptase n=1 Tax=Dipteronia dyeriana TaxID=168575 RepID=A0AAD9U799_9ROSI|nr:hypothetical protein Ddye_016365 [Dipteronia dyeriana]